MPESQNLCEYYFDSCVERISGDEKIIKTPKLYFERSLEKPELPYRLYAVAREWLPGAINDDAYDTVQVCYKQGTTDCARVYSEKENLRIFRRQSNSVDNSIQSVEKSGNILLINEATNFNPSGVGCIEMLKQNQSVARFYFGVNCAFRKKIFYTVEVNGKNAILTFECKTAPKNGIKVRLLGHESRLPCLIADRENCLIVINELKFKRGLCQVSIKLPDNIAEAPERRLFVSLEHECEDMFLLVAKHNCTMPEVQRMKPLSPSYTCPFCHEAIDVQLAKTKAYKMGGVSCSADATSGMASVGIQDENGHTKKNCMVCENDVVGIQAAKDDDKVYKIFPDNFLEHNHFKIAFQGAPRAGKTTYISRFFGLKSKLKPKGKQKISSGREPTADDYDFDCPMTEMKNTTKKFDIVAEPAPIMALNDQRKVDVQWLKKEIQYVNRGMEIGRKLPSTPNGDYTEYPFIVEVNHTNYVSFYDIAGEDSRTSGKYIKKIAEKDENTIGIFFIVTATNKDGNSVNTEVARQLTAAGEYLDPSCPVAVILTKMDALGDRFDSSCACRRFDYYPQFKNFIYDGSDVEKFINDSSEEIKSFIDNEGGVDIEQRGKAAGDIKRFTNVKYFCVSSFGFADSTCRDTDSMDDESYMQFVTSTRRMELPFVWMMRQFGIID